jgi:hypothetical protein
MIINGRLNLSFFLTSREITLGITMSTMLLTGKTTRRRLQRPMRKVLNIKSHIQLSKTWKKVVNQRMNSLNAKIMLLLLSSTLSLQMRRDTS